MGIEDVPTVIFILLVMGMLSFVAYLILDKFTDQLVPQLAAVRGQTYANQVKTDILSMAAMMDIGAAFVAAGFSIGMVAVAFISRSHPFFAPVAFIIQAGMVIIAWLVSGVFTDFIAVPMLAVYAPTFPLTVAVMANLTLFTLAISTIVIIVNYIKPSTYTGVELQ